MVTQSPLCNLVEEKYLFRFTFVQISFFELPLVSAAVEVSLKEDLKAQSCIC